MAEEHSYNTSISMRVNIGFLKEIDSMCRNSSHRIEGVEKIFSDRTDAIKSLTSIGLFIEKNKQAMADPKFTEELNQMIKDEKYMDWIKTLSPTQLNGLAQLIEMRKKELAPQQRSLIF